MAPRGKVTQAEREQDAELTAAQDELDALLEGVDEESDPAEAEPDNDADDRIGRGTHGPVEPLPEDAVSDPAVARFLNYQPPAAPAQPRPTREPTSPLGGVLPDIQDAAGALGQGLVRRGSFGWADELSPEIVENVAGPIDDRIGKYNGQPGDEFGPLDRRYGRLGGSAGQMRRTMEAEDAQSAERQPFAHGVGEALGGAVATVRLGAKRQQTNPFTFGKNRNINIEHQTT